MTQTEREGMGRNGGGGGKNKKNLHFRNETAHWDGDSRNSSIQKKMKQ